MAVTLTSFTTETLRLLNEAGVSSSTIGEVGDGTGDSGTLVSTTQTTITGWLNEAGRELARSCVALPGLATVTPAANTLRVEFSALTMDAAYTTVDYLWWANAVLYGSSALTHCGEVELRAYSPAFENDAAATPTHWYRHGDWGVGLYKKPSGGATALSVYGFATPKNLGDGTGGTVTSWSFLPDDVLLKLVPAYAAGKLALRNTDDPTLAERAFWKDWFEIGKAELWQKLDASLRAPGGAFSTPPSALLGGKR